MWSDIADEPAWQEGWYYIIHDKNTQHYDIIHKLNQNNSIPFHSYTNIIYISKIIILCYNFFPNDI